MYHLYPDNPSKICAIRLYGVFQPTKRRKSPVVSEHIIQSAILTLIRLNTLFIVS